MKKIGKENLCYEHPCEHRTSHDHCDTPAKRINCIDLTSEDDPEDSIEIEARALRKRMTLYEKIMLEDTTLLLRELAEADEARSNAKQPADMTSHLNDTFEVVEFMIEKGRKLHEAAEKRKLEEQQMKALKASTKLQLNDTYEEVGFMVEQSKNLYEAATIKRKAVQQMKAVMKPINKAPASHTVSGSALKAKNVNSPKSNKGVKPKEGSVSKLQASRVAQQKHKKFSHIVSPIGIYINHTPQVTLEVKQKGGASLTAKMHEDSIIRENMACEEIELVKEFEDLNDYNPSIPRKRIVVSPASKVQDERAPNKICGGKKITQLLGPAVHVPTIIRHDGHVQGDGATVNASSHDVSSDDSLLADLSDVTGDVSLQVIRNVNRYLVRSVRKPVLSVGVTFYNGSHLFTGTPPN